MIASPVEARQMSPQMPTRLPMTAASHLTALALASLAALNQGVIASSPTNDDFLTLALSRQVLAGDWPVRDFTDFGVWMNYVMSVASQLVFGYRLLSEAVVVAVMLGVSAYLVFRLVRTLTGSTTAAALSTLLIIVASPRGYSYPKFIVYAVDATLWWAYVQRPSLRRILVFGAWAAASFYWRGDHGLYVAISIALAAVVAHGPGRVAALRVALAGVLAFALVTPFLAMVTANVGLRSSLRGASAAMNAQHAETHMWPDWPFRRPGDVFRLASAEEFAPSVSLRWTSASTPEARRDVLARYDLSPVDTDGSDVQVVRLSARSLPLIKKLINEPIVEDTAGIDRSRALVSGPAWPVWQSWPFSHWWLRFRLFSGIDQQARAGNAAAALFYALPLIVLATAQLWLHWYLPEPVTGTRLAVFALMGIVTAFGMLRSPYDVRAVDDVVVPSILFGCLVTAVWRTATAWSGWRQWLLATVVILSTVLAVKSVAVAGQFWNHVGYLAGEWRSADRMWGAWRDVGARLTASPPLKYWEERGNGPVEMRLARYAAECVSPSQRLLVVWPAPEIYYYSNRLMAGRHLFFDAVDGALPAEKRLTLEKIRRYAPPLVLARKDLDGFTSQFYPGVVAYLRREYDTAGSMEDNGLQYLILARRDARVVRAYGDSGWPCFD